MPLLRVCAIYGKRIAARPIRVTVERLATDGDQILLTGEREGAPQKMLLQCDLDLSERAVERLLKFIERGIKRPRGRS